VDTAGPREFAFSVTELRAGYPQVALQRILKKGSLRDAIR